MKNQKTWMRRLAVAVLALCMGLTVFIGQPMQAQAKEEYACFQLYVESEISRGYRGDFALYREDVYVEAETLCRMAENVEYHRDIAAAWRITKGEASVSYGADEVLSSDGLYVPLVESLVRLGIEGTFDQNTRTLTTKSGRDLSVLKTAMDRMYQNVDYAMRNWQESKEMGGYEFHRKAAAAVDMLRNFKYFTYLFGIEAHTLYLNAYMGILFPAEQEDTAFLEITGEMLSPIYKGNSIAEEATKYFFKEEITKYGSDFDIIVNVLGKTVEYMQVAELASFATYATKYKNAEESWVEGLSLMLQNTKDRPASMVFAGNQALEMYRNQPAVWKNGVLEFGKGVSRDAENVMWSALFPSKFFVEAANLLVDKKYNTQEQLNATLQSAAALDIQKKCGEYYAMRREQHEAGPWEMYDVSLKNMHDVMIVYLRAGIEAYQAMGKESSMTAFSQKIIEQIQQELAVLATYAADDFRVVEPVRALREEVCAYAQQLIKEGQELTMEAPEKNPAIEIFWDAESRDLVYNMPYDLELMFTGTLDNGSYIQYNAAESAYYGSDGTLVAKVAEEAGWIYLELLHMDGVYSFTVENGPFPSNGWIESTEIMVDPAGERLYWLDKDPELNCLYRGATGYWYYEFVIDHGKLRSQ